MESITKISESEKLREELTKFGHSEVYIEELVELYEDGLRKGYKVDYTDFVVPRLYDFTIDEN